MTDGIGVFFSLFFLVHESKFLKQPQSTVEKQI